MFELTAVTNRHLSEHPLLEQLERVFRSPWCPRRLVLREKDLSLQEYLELALQVQKSCLRYNVEFVAHNFPQAALQLKCPLQMPLGYFQAGEVRRTASRLGTSVHSLAELAVAQRSAVDYVVAGHIYATSCKQGVPPRGTAFLREICQVSRVPVYAIGGIKLGIQKQLQELEACGAAGACIMSDYMQL